MIDEGAHPLLRFVGRVLWELMFWFWDVVEYICPRIGRLVFNGILRFKRRLHPVVEGMLGFAVLLLVIVEVGFYVAPTLY